MLPNINLNEFSIEAASEVDSLQGPLWDYLHDSTIRSLISSLPLFLNNLTIDLCGTRLISPDRGREPVYICPLIGDRLPDIQNVRLRLRCICPGVFQTSSSKSKTQPRLKSLVIKLSLPYFFDIIDESYSVHHKFDANPCVASAFPLYKRMIAAGAESAKDFPELSMMRISYRKDHKKNISLSVADCVTQRYLCGGSELFCWEDNGKQWFAWENERNLVDVGDLQELLRS